MKKCVALLLMSAATIIPAYAVPIAQWTFETSAPTSAGPVAPEIGAGTGTAFHANNAAAYSNPTGNGSSESWSANHWSDGDYWQFQVSTLGYGSISVTWDQGGSGTGPGNFVLAFSTDGLTFNQIGADYTVAAYDWNTTAFHSAFTFNPDLTGISSLIADQPSVYFRLVDDSPISIKGGSVGTTGADRIDNFTVNGSPFRATTVPSSSPGIAGLAGLLAILVIGSLSRHRVMATRRCI